MCSYILRYALIAYALAGCAALSPAVRSPARAEAAAVRAGLSPLVLAGESFRLRGYARGLERAPAIVIYIEGDGRAWRSRTRVSNDPTPREATGLRLAALDHSAAVLYLARPCQFVAPDELADCDRRFWTGERYSATVIAALDSAIDEAIGRQPGAAARARLGLVGFSGGGAVAALLAARRDDVAWLVTVAGNLDHRAWTEHHHLTALEGSLNPLDFAAVLTTIPQAHLSGVRDRVVPPALLAGYVAGLGPGNKAVTRAFAEFDHTCCWQQVWPEAACGLLREVTDEILMSCGAPASVPAPPSLP